MGVLHGADRTYVCARGTQPARVFRDFLRSTKESWSRRRRVIARAEWTGGEANPVYVVEASCLGHPTALREPILRPRRNGEPDQGMPANKLRLWFSSMAYVLIFALRRIGLTHSQVHRCDLRRHGCRPEC
jgi:hypothetical protein